MKILGISLSEFHDKAGFQLVQSVPSVTVLTQEQFNIYSDLILPRDELCGRLLAFEFKEDYFLVVKPLLSKNQEQDKTYKRQKYIYSISILVGKEDYLDRVKQPLYKQSVSKIARFFKMLEENSHIIYHHSENTKYILELLTKIYDDVNRRGHCSLTHHCNYYTFINTNHPGHFQKRIKITQASVPVTLLTERQIEAVESDLGRDLLRYAHRGTYSFRKICRYHSDRKETELKEFYTVAVKKGLVFMLDMINLHNVYVLTQKVTDYVTDSAESKRQLKEIASVVNVSQEELNTEELLCLYFQFNRVATLARVIQANRRLISRLDIVKLIRMGQIYGFLVRNHQKIAYRQLPSPLVMVDSLKKWLAERDNKLNINEKIEEELENMTEAVKKYLNLGLTIDEMMVNLDVDYDRLLALLNADNRFILQINDE